jgi:TolB-like protein/AraC-like DNA-binding protein
MSHDSSDEYFSDGITEEIINSLARIEGLHVTARTSSFAFKNRNEDVREIGKQLNVSLLLEGSIRRSDSKIRITAQLVRTGDGYHVWSDTWDRELKNIFILQDEISGIIAKKINAGIQPESIRKEKTIESTEALDNYLRGTFLQNRWDISRSHEMISYFEKAIEIDPGFAKAYIALCNGLTWMGAIGQTDPVEANTKIDLYLAKAMELDKNLEDIYAIIAGKKYWIEWNIPEALNNVNKALDLRPSFADAMLHKGLILATMGNIEESLDYLFQSERLNPFHTNINYCIGLIYRLTNEYERSLAYVEKNIRLAPFWYAQYSLQLEVLCLLKRFDEAWQVIVGQEQNPNSPLPVSEMKAIYYAFRGEKQEASRLAAQIQKMADDNPVAMAPTYAYLDLIYLLIGDNQKAIDVLVKGVRYRSAPILFITLDNLWDNLRDHPAFIAATAFLRTGPVTHKTDPAHIKYKKTPLSADITKKLKVSLNDVMVKEKPYLDPKLNLSDLAELVHCSSNQLSQLLNENLGKNFYDYVNEYRLQYFQQLNRNPRNRQFTFLSLAYESGFNSKTTFNNFFKKSLGVTPSEYFK